MILIKDRHFPLLSESFANSKRWKYDTYKGLTLSMISMNNHIWGSGTMILIKNRHEGLIPKSVK